ncbi:hypothetical protein JCM1840_007421 [Sporobolomyces johnsonii]
MRTVSTVFVTLAAAASAMAQATLQINTPTALYTCEPYLVSWSGGTAPYYVRVVPGGELAGTPLGYLDSQPTTDTSYTWTVNIAADTSITLTITDSTGNTQATAPVTIQAGSSTSCIGSSSSSAVASSSAASSSAASSSAASSSAAPASTASSSASSSASPSASSSASSVSSSASSVASSASSASSSAASSAASSASKTSSVSTTATGSTGAAASQTSKSGAGKVVYGSALALIAGAVAAVAA